MKISKTFSLICTVCTLIGCSQKYNGFTLQGTYEGNDTPTLYLSYTDSSGKGIMDSVVVASGSFHFTGGIKEPTMALLWKGSINDRNNPNIIRFYLDLATMRLFLNESDFSAYTLTGAPTHDLYIELNNRQKVLYDQMGTLRTKELAATDDLEKADIEKQLGEVSAKLAAINMEFMHTHPESVVSAYVMRFALSSMDYKTAESIYNSFSEDVKNSSFGKDDLAELQRKLKGEPGQKAKLFIKTDIDGKELDLPELNKDHYILLDFWASWCAPCRRGNPHLLALHNKYLSKGLLIVCIADDDNAPDKWKGAVAQDGIGVLRHVLRGLKRTEHGFDRSEDISDDFGVSVLPTKILIDRSGTIMLNCQEDTDALDAKLQEIFGE